VPIISSTADAAPHPRGRLAVASASLYAPDGRRRWTWLSIRCPYCTAVHLGRVRTPDEAEGPRRMACGRLALVVVRRRYGREVA
jgi:hypothetical protein